MVPQGLRTMLVQISKDDIGDIKGLLIEEWLLDDLQMHLSERVLKSLRNGSAVLQIKARVGASGKIVIDNFRGKIALSVHGGSIDVQIGKCGKLKISVDMYGPALLNIGSKTTINSATIAIASGGVTIGQDCMLSHEIHLQSCDQHGIVDLDTEKIINKKRTIKIGDHVWIGRRVTVVPGVEIASGSILAIGAVVSRSVLGCTIVAGNPAKVVRSGVSWSRELLSVDEASAIFMDTVRTP